MRYRALYSLLFATLALILVSCSQGGGLDPPVAPDLNQPAPNHAVSSGPMVPGHNLLGYWTINIDPDAGILEAVPVRSTDLHLNVLSWLENGPCTDCLKLENFSVLPNGDFQFDIKLVHPFALPNLTGFDVRGIAMFNGGLNFPSFNVTVPDELSGDPILVNAEGHTKLYNPSTAGNAFQGYSKGRLAPPFPVPDATLNGFRTFYSDPDRRYFNAGDTISSQYIIRPPGGGLTFGYAVDASWDKPTQPVEVPDSFPDTANSLEAYLVEVSYDQPLTAVAGSTTTLTIDVYDWQGESTIRNVHVEAPYFLSGMVTAEQIPGGPGTLRFTATLENTLGSAAEGEYPVLVRVLDTESHAGSLIDNIAWKLIYIPLTDNSPPVCAAEADNYDPEPLEDVTFTDTSTDPDGLSDLAESWWDWDNDGTWDEEGFEVIHSFDTEGVFKVNHRVIDSEDAEDVLDEPLEIDVGLLVSLEEDLEAKTIDLGYYYQSLDANYDYGNLIDVSDTDGPWDFTAIGLEEGTNRVNILDDEDPQVSGFVGNFNDETELFVQYQDMFDPFFPLLYEAEYHNFTDNELYIYGFHDPYVIGSSPFGPPDTDKYLAIPYPIDSDTDYTYIINETSFRLNYGVKTIGEGDVTVPFGGGSTMHCLLVRYRFTVVAPEPVNGATLNFAFVADNGQVVANVIAVNDPPMYNWNTTTNTILSTGNAMFQALELVE
jgi:hypothetical protein